MNICGFRIYAINLVKLLAQEIYGLTQDQLSKQRKQSDTTKFPDAPLKALIRSDTFEEWAPFGEIDSENQEEVKKLEVSCQSTHA